MRWQHWLATALAIAPIAVGAQQQAAVPEAAVQAATRFLRAVERGEWRTAGAMLDSQSVAGPLQQVLAPPTPGEIHRLTVEDLQRADPDMPRAVAEYTLKKHEQAMPHSFVERDYAGVSSPDSLRAMSVREVGARWIEARDVRYQMRLILAEMRSDTCATRAAAILASDSGSRAAAPQFKVLGGFPAKRGAWVAYEERRYSPSSADSLAPYTEFPLLLRLVRSGGEWKIVARPDMFANAMAFSLSPMCENVK